MYSSRYTIILSSLILCLVGCFPSKDLSKQELLIQGRTMGTTYHIKLVVPDVFSEQEILKKAIDKELKSINQSMSTYIKDSELSLFNQYQASDPYEISPRLSEVIAESLRLGYLSEGKLDITVGPLVNLWGFGPNFQPETIPSDELLNETLERVGLEHLSLNEDSLIKSIPSLYVDLSTIAKGYGVDRISALLEARGFHHYLVEIGGEMRLKGFKRSGELWHVAIEKPVTTERAVHQVIVPKNNAVATSGDYRNYFEKEGQRFSHIIDPDSGKPINHKIVSVTVIHPSAMTADGLSTMLMVMGEEQALPFANKNNIAAYIIYKTDNGFVEQSTLKFMPYLK